MQCHGVAETSATPVRHDLFRRYYCRFVRARRRAAATATSPVPNSTRLAGSGTAVIRVGSLESRRVDVEVIAATNRNLRTESAAGRFRSDLFYRLSIIEIHLVPLRERRDDIPYLTARFIKELSARLKRTITGVSAAAELLLQEARWPGNVRELKNVIERACILGDGKILSERDVHSALSHGQTAPPSGSDISEAPADRHRLSTAHREQIERVLGEVGGNKAKAAKLLGVSRRSLYSWLDRLNID